MEKNLPMVKGQNALQALAARLQVDPAEMQKTLKATAFRECVTNEQFLAAVIVANAYGLNPLTREIFAFAGKKGEVIPVVSTDGWTRLMVNHKLYKTHRFVYSEDTTTPPGGKPCPEWCEIHIEKQDGSITVTREYLDEVYREAVVRDGRPINGPWQTHTKRFLRHKTKIQGARETFGFGGIYDEDEAGRIREAEDGRPGKPIVQMPRAIEEGAAQPEHQGDQPEHQAEEGQQHSEESRTPPANGRRITEPQAKRMYAIAAKRGISKERVADLAKTYGYSQVYDILMADYDKIVAAIERMSADEREPGSEG